MNHNKTKCPRSTHRKKPENKPAKKSAERKQTDRNTTNKNSMISTKNTTSYGIKRNVIKDNINKKNDKHEEIFLNREKGLSHSNELKLYKSCVFPFLGYYAY